MNGIMNWISNSYHSIMQTIGLEKPKPPETVQKEVPAEQVKAESLSRGEERQKAEANQGTAMGISSFITNQKAGWEEAGKGTTIPEIQMRVQQGADAANAIYEYLDKNTNLSPEQWDNVTRFLEGVMSHGNVESQNPRWDQTSLHNVLNEGVSEFGITEEQVNLLAEGDFSVASYVDMVRDGKPIA